MSQLEPKTMMCIAEELLSSAEKEMERSAEDVVTHLVCFNSRASISNFLKAYLLNEQIELVYPISLSSLLKQCQTVDARFDLLDLEDMHCRMEAHDQDYCLEYKQVDTCMKVAQQARSIVMSSAPAY